MTPSVPERLAVVGGDAAGMSAAAIARRRDPDLEIVAFERGPYTSYSACGIPYYLAGEIENVDSLITRSPEEFRASGVDVRTGSEVVGIDLDRRTLTVRRLDARTEYEEGFDRLVYATGAEAVPPPIEGADALEPVLKVDAAERFRAEVAHHPEATHAVVIGASYLGLEMAEAMVMRGLRRRADRPGRPGDDHARRRHGEPRQARRRGRGHPGAPLHHGRGGGDRRRRAPASGAHGGGRRSEGRARRCSPPACSRRWGWPPTPAWSSASPAP